MNIIIIFFKITIIATSLTESTVHTEAYREISKTVQVDKVATMLGSKSIWKTRVLLLKSSGGSSIAWAWILLLPAGATIRIFQIRAIRIKVLHFIFPISTIPNKILQS